MTTIPPIGSIGSSWINWTTPADTDASVSRTDDFIIQFTTMMDPLSFKNDCFSLIDNEGNVHENAFLPIEIENDYSPYTMRLLLHPAEALLPGEYYTLVINGLYNAAGDGQDRIHTVYFTTNDNDVDFTPIVAQDNILEVEDHTISNSVLVDAGSAHTVYMNPVDGSYNIPGDTSSVTLTIYPDDVTSVTASISRRQVSKFELPWTLIAATIDITDNVVTVELPLSGAYYVEPGYEYKVNISIDGTEAKELFFCGELAPLFNSVQSVMIQLPGISAYLVAKYLYIAGSDIIALDSSFESSPTKACAEYSLYSTLTELSQFNGISKYVLGDLEVTRSGEASLYEKWKALADVAYAKIIGVGPKYISREYIRQSNPSKHAARDWDAAGTPKRRIGQ